MLPRARGREGQAEIDLVPHTVSNSDGFEDDDERGIFHSDKNGQNEKLSPSMATP